MAGLAIHALAIGDTMAAFIAFATAAMTIAVVMAFLVTAISLAQVKVVASLKKSSRSVKRGSGFILLSVGIWLIALAIWAEPFEQILFP